MNCKNEMRFAISGGAWTDRKDEVLPRPNISVALRHSLKPTGKLRQIKNGLLWRMMYLIQKEN